MAAAETAAPEPAVAPSAPAPAPPAAAAAAAAAGGDPAAAAAAATGENAAPAAPGAAAEAAPSAAAAPSTQQPAEGPDADASPSLKRKRDPGGGGEDPIRVQGGGWRPTRIGTAERNLLATRRSALQLWRLATPAWRSALRERMRITGDNMQKITLNLRLRNQLRTAMLGMWYMWRFYHGSEGKPGHSFGDFDRRVMMSACLFLASKNENALFRLGDLVTVAWGHAHRSPEWYKRRQQITDAELYLIAAILGFDFSYSLPTTSYCALLQELAAADTLGKHGLPWCIAGSQLFILVFLTPLCVHYSADDLARCMLRRTRKEWESCGNVAWLRPLPTEDGTGDADEMVQVSDERWEQVTRVDPRVEAEFSTEMDQIDFRKHFQAKVDDLTLRFSRRGMCFSRTSYSRSMTARTASPDRSQLVFDD